jgi:folate-binding protein YgfZ
VARTSPLEQWHDRAGAVGLPYGPQQNAIRVVQTYGELGLEYAAIRRSAALLDWPQHAALEVRGSDRIAFLNRMVTQELKGLGPGQTRRSFWLNRKGRIDADITLVELGDRMLAIVDALAAERTVKGLTDYVIAEDVSITDVSTGFHHFGLHGPRSWDVLGAAGGPSGSAATPTVAPGEARSITVGGVPVIAVRDDACGETGFELVVETPRAADVYARLLEFAHEHEADPAARIAARDSGAPRLRPAGWLAFNTARIEAGTPVYNIDFGPDALPHESGVLHERVSFKKGCYLGQEIVARMESRGHSKRALTALRCEEVPPRAAEGGAPPTADPGFDRPMPVTGGGVYASADAAEAVGTVTSATLSPMLGAAPICFAAIKPGHAAPGTTLRVDAEGLRLPAVVQPTLRFHGPA